jgi:hypothetical protein
MVGLKGGTHAACVVRDFASEPTIACPSTTNASDTCKSAFSQNRVLVAKSSNGIPLGHFSEAAGVPAGQ